jgi:hypothetical protein
MNIVEVIRRDHDELAQMFEELAQVARDDRRRGSGGVRLCSRLVVAARVHARAEERVVYEVLRTCPGPLKAFALAGPHEHEMLDITLDKLLVQRPSEELGVIVRVARDLFAMHARDEEETDLLPLLANALSEEDLDGLARDLAAEKARIRPHIERMAAMPARAA